MNDTEQAAAFAIALAKKRHRDEVGPDELLLGCLRALSRFGVVQIGSWTLDLEEFGVDWLDAPPKSETKVAYSQPSVDLFDRAARIATADGSGTIRVFHLLVAFAVENEGLMGDLKRSCGITSSTWRAAVARSWIGRFSEDAPLSGEDKSEGNNNRSEYLTPEDAAEALSIHVQTVRAYVRSGKLPALRLAGERAIRIRRADLETVLEPLVPQT
jgi:excisionase family DNA binding protein